MSIVRQHILYLLMKSAARNGHGFAREVVQALFPFPNAGNAASARHVKREVTSTWAQVAVHIAAPERGVPVSNDLLKRMRHSKNTNTECTLSAIGRMRR